MGGTDAGRVGQLTAAVNDRVRVGEGTNGELIVLGAWCAKCGCEAMPIDGRCPWCQSVIVDEETLPVRDVLAQVGRETVGLPAGQALAPRRGGRRPSWSRESALAAVGAFASEHEHPPRSHDGGPKNALPSEPTAAKLFGSWAAMIEAAGFERPTRGTRYARPVLSERGTDREATALPDSPPAAPGEVSSPVAVFSDPGGPDVGTDGSAAPRSESIAVALRSFIFGARLLLEDLERDLGVA
jgi:hypothetical protein